jgi:phenylpropionate dioxygenase-like ring-hydroxylating dioxygenase large terminal subunit
MLPARDLQPRAAQGVEVQTGQTETVAQRQERLGQQQGYPADRLSTRVDVAAMLTPEHFALEREKIFRRAWLMVGHTDDVPQRGSYVVFDVPTFNTSLLIVRGQDDQVRVFHNACRHRGNKLVRGGEGCRKSFMCNFHGWIFGNDGKLEVITDPHMFEAVDKNDYGLIPVTSEVWENLIFVNFDAQPRETLEEYLGPEFYGRYQGYWDLHQKVASYSFEIKANWHLGVNSFTEGYHTLYLHKNTTAIRRRATPTTASCRWSRSPSTTAARCCPRSTLTSRCCPTASTRRATSTGRSTCWSSSPTWWWWRATISAPRWRSGRSTTSARW